MSVKTQLDYDRWRNLVVETQYATELIVGGIRKICEIPTETGFTGIGYSEKYPLNIALHMHTSGLERLCKSTLACYGFLETGEFSKVQKYSHRLSRLLDAVEALDLGKITADSPRYPSRPDDEFGDELVSWLERYASGMGRYEILDSLSDGQVEVITWDKWLELCAIGTVSDGIKQNIGLRYAAMRAIRHAIGERELETSASGILEVFDSPLSEGSSAVGVAMYRRARWVASALVALTHYTHRGLPILSEVLYVLLNSSELFYSVHIALLADDEVVSEELGEYYGQHDVDGDDDFNDLD